VIEIRIHGRGGQGGVTLAKIIATTRFLKGDSVQAFGLYAAERAGAPIQAFCRYAGEPITNRNLIYEPDHIVVLDQTLVAPAIASGLKPGGWILVNSGEPPSSLAADFEAYRVATVDATRIARDNKLGTRSVPIVNTALAGAVGKILEFDLGAIHAALEHLGFTGGNLTAASTAWDEVGVAAAIRHSAEAALKAPSPKTAPAPSFLQGAGGGLPGIRTGQWAAQRPQRQQMVPPCNHICPAGNDVQGFLHALAGDDVDEALTILLQTSPFPSICGRVCPAPCMDNCNRIALDGAVNVRQLERYAGDNGRARLVPSEARDERIAVIGSGPAGLTAAYHLSLAGYRVTVFEAGPQIGGLLHSGIPEFRLPTKVLDQELERISSLGVEFKTGVRVTRPTLLELARNHDAVLVATGLQELRGLRLGTESDSDAILQGIEFLDEVKDDGVDLEDEEVVVVGGGNTAVDAARSALRLGARSVRLVYRRTRDEMPAIREEIDEAIEEGVAMQFLTQPVAASGNGSGPSGEEQRPLQLRCRRMELGAPDESGRQAPLEIPNSDFEIVCDRLILALGQSPDLSVFPEGTEVREGELLLGLLETPVFAIGDLASGEGTVAAAIGSGRRSALNIHETLSGSAGEDPGDGIIGVTGVTAEAQQHVDVIRSEVILPEAMKLHFFERQAVAEGAHLAMNSRRSTFEEVHQGLDDVNEAKRCLSCGVCNECDACVTYCPEGVLKRVGRDFVFDYSFCKGCAVCATECPRNVVFMSHL
jgi:2-oxoacid:acceptor oxidoreductase gamma subunit (pyruvate/2-ketoisovalerate family)